MALKADRTIRWKERIGTMVLGHTAKTVEVFLFDTLLYGSVVTYLTTQFGWMFGSFVSFAIMAPLSALWCSCTIRLYDWAKLDWFGLEATKRVRDELSKGGQWMRLIQCIIQLGDIPAFFAILFLHPLGDPFMVTLYLRKGAEKYNGLTKRDYCIFWAAVIVSNGYWTLRWTAIVELVRQFLWPLLVRPVLQLLGFN